MRRKVKFQGEMRGAEQFGEETDSTSVGLNSLLENAMNSKLPNQGSGSLGGVFSDSNQSDLEEDASAWTFSSFGQTSRLYGRAKEKALLKGAYRRLWQTLPGSPPTVQLALIRGDSGVGKSTLAMSLKDRVLGDEGFFLMGKFDQRQSSECYSAFVSALTQLVEDVIQRGPAVVQAMKNAIESAIHTEQRLLTDMIPALEKVLGTPKKDTVKEFRQSADEVSCFKFVFRMFVRAISSPDYPIVFLLDDLHLADMASLELFEALASDLANDGVLFIATYCPQKSFDERIANFLKKEGSLSVMEIPVGNLDTESVDEMIAELFSVVDARAIKPLTDLIYRQTEGNVFYIREFLRFLQEERLLTFDEMGMEWIWDERKILNRIEFRTAAELLSVRLSGLPQPTLEVLEVAACLGSILDEKLLNRISPRPVFTHLQKATARGLLMFDAESDTYQFSHDMVQEAAYRMISPQEREAFHLTIGRELWKSFDDIEELEDNIFIILGQIRDGAELISYQEERNDVGALCLRAGELAICSSSFQIASEYLLLGVSMLGPTCWTDEYELSLELHNAAAEVEYSISNFDNVEKLASEIFAKTRWFPDTLRAHAIHVYSLGSRGHMLKAIEKGLTVLSSLGEKFNMRLSSNTVAVAVKRTKWMLRGKTSEELLRMRLMDNQEKIAAMQMMNIMFLYAYIAVPSLAPLLAVRMVKLTLEYGLCDVSSVGFVTFGMLLCGNGKDVEQGYRCGELAMRLYEKFDNKNWLGRVSAWFFGSVCPWKRPIRQIFEPIKKAHRVALETGDIDFAMLNANIYSWESFDISSLTKLERIIVGFHSRLEAYGQDSTLMMIKPLWQMVHNLQGRAAGDPKVLTGEIMDQDYTIQYARENNKTLLIWSHFYRMLLSYLLGDVESAEVHAEVCRVAETNPFGSSDRVLLVFYDGLVALAQGDKNRANVKLANRNLKAANKSIKALKNWAKQCPENFLGKLYFLEAELAAATGNPNRAHSKYTSAISLSREGGYLLQHALANERAGKYFLSLGQTKLAKSYLREALSVYHRWGGITKVEHLQTEISHIVDLSGS